MISELGLVGRQGTYLPRVYRRFAAAVANKCSASDVAAARR